MLSLKSTFAFRTLHPQNIRSNFIMKSISSDFSTLQVGLTGSIGMGKSTVANQLKLLGFPVFDADHHVHKLYLNGGGAVDAISQIFPHVIIDNSVNRAKLMETVLSTPSALSEIEQIVHPLVVSARQQFYREASERGHFLVVYDIPLLFENKAKHNVDYTIVVTANPNVQKERVLNRQGMTVEKFESILAKQMSDAQKRELADFIIHTDYQGYTEAKSQLATIIEKIIRGNEDKWAAWKNRNRLEAIIASNTIPASIHIETSSPDSPDTPSTPSTPSAAPLFDMLLFDLDDTLSPTATQLGLAYRAMTSFIESHMPLSCNDMKTNYVEIVSQIKRENPLIVHDLNELRLRAMRHIAGKHGEEGLVEQAMETFFTARNDIEKNLFDDVLECSRWATQQGMKIGILTNGTADLSKCTQLTPFISVYLTAAELGVCKPSPVAFYAGIEKSGFLPKRILYIGDSYEHDVLGAKNAGMYSAWLVRNGVNTGSEKVRVKPSPFSSMIDTNHNKQQPQDIPNFVNHNNNPINSPKTSDSATNTNSTTGNEKDEKDLMIERAESPLGTDFSQADIVLNSLRPEEMERKIREFLMIDGMM